MRKQFQYISCFGFILYLSRFMDNEFIFQYISCFGFIILDTGDIVSQYKFQYISCFGFMFLSSYPFPIYPLISIHLMFWFYVKPMHWVTVLIMHFNTSHVLVLSLFGRNLQ